MHRRVAIRMESGIQRRSDDTYKGNARGGRSGGREDEGGQSRGRENRGNREWETPGVATQKKR